MPHEPGNLGSAARQKTGPLILNTSATPVRRRPTKFGSFTAAGAGGGEPHIPGPGRSVTTVPGATIDPGAGNSSATAGSHRKPVTERAETRTRNPPLRSRP